MNSRHGDLDRAHERLDRAQELRPRDRTLQHTRAGLLARMARLSSDELLRKGLRSDARGLLNSIKGDEPDPYISSSRAQIAIDELEDLLSTLPPEADLTDQPRALRLIEDAEGMLTTGLSRFSGFEALVKQEVRLRRLLGQRNRAEKLLARTLLQQPHLEYIALAYARTVRNKDLDAALSAIRTCLVLLRQVWAD